ncbi:MAG TPA: DUF6600 domain-containing protein [Bryobacteraceae bacterium]|nr:DUF6600 domain-containing protein [Bryobacteraceae bacterium]
MLSSTRLIFLATASILVLSAQTDPPGRASRVSYLSGAVSFRPGDMDDWVPAQINRPLTTGDHIWTDQGARAELHIGTAALRLNSGSAFEFLNLDDSTVQIRLTEGSLNVRLRSLGEGETFEVDTPNLAFSLLRTGVYRIDVNPDTTTTVVTVRGGEGEVTGGNQAFPVRPGEQASVAGTDSLRVDTFGAPAADEWDDWCVARDRREDQSPSARYVSRDLVGYQDLDSNGDWRTLPEYGAVWAPRGMAVGWAPYHYGHWVWVEPWGWTWIDDAPWGFAPFHYGRWVYVGYWAWVPGPVAVRPVYAPALVAWVGGPGFRVSFGAGVAGVAWFPLGPREVYVPAYRASPTYINRVNVTNTTIVNNINITNINTTNVRYVNREAPGAVTAVPQSALANARPVQSAAVAVPVNAIRSAQVMNTAPVAPNRQSVLGAGTPGARVVQPPAAVQNRAVVAKLAPPPAPVPFAQRQQALAANPGRPLDSGEVQSLRGNQPAPARPYVRPARGSFGAAGRPQVQTPSAPPQTGAGQQRPAEQPRPGEFRPNQPPLQPNRTPPQPRPVPAQQPEPGGRRLNTPPQPPNNPQRPAANQPPARTVPPRSSRPVEPQGRPAPRVEERKAPPKKDERKEEHDR